MSAQSYTAFDRVLHKLALNFGPLAELSFDLDQASARRHFDLETVKAERHVFVAGLARSGTTILMRRLHASGAFASLTYRNMPFVLSPGFAQRFAGTKPAPDALKERAHGDGLMVNSDSPEALDEAFWRVFDGDAYIGDEALRPHKPSKALMTQFASYVGAILASTPNQATRYLSKNNNNILRLRALSETFPNAQFLIPIRHPDTHIASLLSQHRRFREQQTEDPFVATYMRSLAHHEFGGDHRPFRFDTDAPVSSADCSEANYWLDQWIAAYLWLQRTAPSRSLFVNYEALCVDPAIWKHIEAVCGIDDTCSAYEPFQLPKRAPLTGVDASKREQAIELYEKISSGTP